MSHDSVSTSGPQLPEHFQRPQRADASKVWMFTTPFDHALAQLQVSRDELKRWADLKWLSFDPAAVEQVGAFGNGRVNEVQFIRDFVRSGLSDAQLQDMVDRAEPPLNFNPMRVAWSFAYGWAEPNSSQEYLDSIVEQRFEGYLETLAEEGSTDRLQQIQSTIRLLLKACGIGSEEHGQ